MTDPLDLDALAALLEKATPGPWRQYERLLRNEEHGIMRDVPKWGDGGLGSAYTEADAALIIAAVNALPELLQAARELERRKQHVHRVAEDDADSGVIAHCVDCGAVIL